MQGDRHDGIDDDGLAALQARISHRFRDPALLLRALTHSSFANEHGVMDNERLEYLGDAVLELVVTSALYNRYPRASEGRLSELRSVVVGTASLAMAAREWGLDAMLRLGRGERVSGGATKESILEGSFEAVVGAVFLDSDFPTCQRVLAAWLDRILDGLEAHAPVNYKSLLQRLLQAEVGGTPSYEVRGESGPAHERIFQVEVRLGSRVLGEGKGRSIKKAGQVAARNALARLRENGMDLGLQGGPEPPTAGEPGEEQ